MSRLARDFASSAHHPEHHPTNSQPNGSSSPMEPLIQKLGRFPKIAIIGAGVSGLRCADLLIRSGANVTIHEARNRVGGRLHQQRSGGHLMDMGPNWIHGSKGNPILRLAEKTATTVVPLDEQYAVFDSAGQMLHEKVAAELSETMWSTIAEAYRHSDSHLDSISPQSSLYDFFVSSLTSKINDTKKLELVLNQSRHWGNFVGDPIERQSLKFFFLEQMIDDSNVFVASTYQAILQEIARSAVAKQAIMFDSEIVQITQQLDCVILTTTTGEQHSYDEVVITCPLGWLKRHHATAFTPPLPIRLTAAIDNISYGRLEKLYVTFPKAWWLSSFSDSSPAWPAFTNFHPPTYHPTPSSQPPHHGSTSWSQSVVSLAHLPPPHAHPTLLFYIHGPCSTALVSSVAKLSPNSPEYFNILIDFSRPFFSLLPNYDANEPECQPTALLCTQWQNDKFAGNGAYCNFQVGLEHADEDIEVMREVGALWRGGHSAGATEGAFGATSRTTVSKGTVSTASVSAETSFPTTSLPNGVDPSSLAQAEADIHPEAQVHSEAQTNPTTQSSSTKDLHPDRPLGPGGIHLAGEHVAPFVAIGTTTGAYWSGEAVARRILRKWGVAPPLDG